MITFTPYGIYKPAQSPPICGKLSGTDLNILDMPCIIERLEVIAAARKDEINVAIATHSRIFQLVAETH